MTVLLSLLLGSAFAQDADVRFLHLSSDAGELEAYVGGAFLAGGVDYLESSAAAPVTSGFQAVTVAESGSGGLNPYASNLVNFDPGGAYDLVAYGSESTMQILPLTDDPAGIPVGANRLQFSHCAEGVIDIDIYLPSTSATLADDLPYGGNDSSVVAASGPFTIMLDVDDDQGADYIFSMPDLGTEQFVNLLLVGEDENLSFVIWDSDGTTEVIDGIFIPKPTVQFVHLSPDMPAADVFVGFGFVPLFENITFGTASLPTPIKRGVVGFTLAPAGLPPTSPFGAGSTRLEAETDYTVFAYNLESQLQYGKVIDMPEDPTLQGVRVLHTALGIGPVQLMRDGVVTKPFAGRGQGLEEYVPPGGFELGFDNTFDGVADYAFAVPDYGLGHVNLFLATNELLETRLYVDQPDGTLLVLDPL